MSDKMDKKKFDEIMDQWAAHEMEAAPDLQPSPDVYRRLEGKKKKPRFAFFSWPVRLAAAGIAAALIILVIVVQPPKEVEPLLGLREGAVTDITEKVEVEDRMQALGKTELEEAEMEEQVQDAQKPDAAKIQRKAAKDVKQEGLEQKKRVAEEPPVKTEIVEKMEKAKEVDKEMFAQPTVVAERPRKEIIQENKEVKSQAKRSQIATVAAAAPAQVIAERIEFQYQSKGSESFVSLDIVSSQDETLSLASEDNYRLSLLLPRERFVYVFQVGTEEQPIRLFPNPVYNPSENPLQAGKSTTIPLPPNWFYVEKEKGEVRLYILTSAKPLRDWDDVDATISVGWLDQIEKDKGQPEAEVFVCVFRFNIH